MKKAIAAANNPKAKVRAMYYIACCDYAEIPNGKLLDCFLEFYKSGNIPSIFKSYEVEN